MRKPRTITAPAYDVDGYGECTLLEASLTCMVSGEMADGTKVWREVGDDFGSWYSLHKCPDGYVTTVNTLWYFILEGN